MFDTVRRYVEAGRDALTPKKAEELARALIQQGQARADQAGRVARDLVEWSKKNSERFRETVRNEVRKQMTKAGVATKDDVEALKRRIRELESQAKSTATRKPATTRAAGASRASSPRSGSTKSTTTGATRVPRGGTARKSAPPGSPRG